MKSFSVIILTIAILLAVIAVCSFSLRPVAIHTVDRMADAAIRPMTTDELILKSRQTAPQESSGRVWIVTIILSLAILSAVAAMGWMYFSRGYMAEKSKLLRAQKRHANKRQPLPSPVISAPQIGQVQRVRPVAQLPASYEEY